MKRSVVTYRQLDKVLRSLDFSCQLVKDAPQPTRVYRHGTGAVIMLPAFPKEEKVLAYQLIAARIELENFGIADPTSFEATLQKAG